MRNPELLLILLIVLIAVAGVAIWMIGSDTMRSMGWLLLVGLLLIGLIGASSLPIRAWRGPETRPEKHIIRETKVIDNRAQAALPAPQIVALSPSAGGVFPDMLRAAFQAGAARQGGLPSGARQPGRTAGNEPIGAGWGDVWDGQAVGEWGDEGEEIIEVRHDTV